jgi:hypothetical protein
MKTSLFYVVEPDYLKAMGISLERGRFLGPADNEHSPFVIVIDEEFAKLYFAGQNPIGRRVNLAILNQTAEIVGVVGHVKQWGLAEDAHSPVQAQFYMSISQTSRPVHAAAGPRWAIRGADARIAGNRVGRHPAGARQNQRRDRGLRHARPWTRSFPIRWPRGDFR